MPEDNDEKMTVQAKARPAAEDLNRPKTEIPAFEKSNTRMQSVIPDKKAEEIKDRIEKSE